ncbi:MAG: AMP-binding protein, partial [Bradyrhizobium sp.]
MNIAHLLTAAARRAPTTPAVVLDTRMLHDYRGLARRVGTLAGALQNRLRLRADDRVAVAMKNTPEYVEVLFAAWHAGLVVVPINASLHPREIAHILEDSGARTCFVTPEPGRGIASLPALPASLDRLVDVASRDYAELLGADPIGLVERAPEDVAWLFYTSGTTGRPKGVMLTHRNLTMETLCYLADVDAVSPGDGIIHAAPMSHGSGLYIMPHVARAACNIVPASGGFNPAEICSLLGAHAGITMFCAPTMVRRLVEHAGISAARLAHLKTIVYGGGPMYVADLKRALDVFGNKLVQIYGQGESPMTITCLSRAQHAACAAARHDARLASVGVPFTGIEVGIADAEDRWLATGETGEILVRGDTVMRGYWRNRAATAEALRGGWLHTGDVGVLDEEGFLTLKDRSKDVIISGGSNVYPREVEEVLLLHPGVREVSVVGRPDAEWGEEVTAFVATEPGMRVDGKELDRLCLDHIARFKRPRQYVFVDALPKNEYGKVLKT